jgi:putative nucleotidyltransferase with HDIG domain
MRVAPRHAKLRTTLTVVGTASAAAAAAAWYFDAARRSRENAQLHRTLVELLLNVLSAGDEFTEHHCRRVAELTDSFAIVCRMNRDRRATLRVASLLHDLGKIDDEFFDIVHGTKPLTREERARIEQHPHESAQILEPLEPFHPGLTRIVESHHERWDGEGYPRGLRGDEIPLESRIISIADVFDALTQRRSYKEPQSVESALAEIRDCAGYRFDPEVVRQLDQPGVMQEWRRIARDGRRAEGDLSESGVPGGPSARRSESEGRGDRLPYRSSSR